MSVTKANRDIKSLQPIAQKACELFLNECKKRNIPIFITETHRSQARQDYLYEQGRTRPGQIVTWTRSSNHTGGYAWDIAVNPPHELYDAKIIAKAGKVAKELGIEWGGTWKEQDTPHFQVDKNWKAPTTEPQVPEWQMNSVHSVCDRFKLDKNYWLPRADKPITVGEMMGLLNKLL